MFRKGKTSIIAKLHRTDLIIYSHFKEGKMFTSAEMLNYMAKLYGSAGKAKNYK